MSSPECLFPQVAEQPLWFSDSVPNVRKLQELPMHLLGAGRVQELKQEVLGEEALGRATHPHAETGGVCPSVHMSIICYPTHLPHMLPLCHFMSPCPHVISFPTPHRHG